MSIIGENTTLYDTIALARSLPRGQGVVNELAHEGPYCHGITEGGGKNARPTKVVCPYCKAPVKLFEYPEVGIAVYLCKEIGFFTPSPAGKITTKIWRYLIRETASTWVKVAANRNTGQN
jgi:hypothetical protein